MDLLEAVFPKRCVQCRRTGSYICTNCFASIDFSTETICAVCSKPAIGGLTHPICRGKYTIDGVISSVAYKGAIKKLMYQYKYKPYLRNLTSILGELFYEGIIQNEAFFRFPKEGACLIPVPLAKKRYLERGYNPALLLAQDMGKRLSMPVRDLLTRVKETELQAKLGKEERQKNVKQAFALHRNKVPLRVFLVDDIITSGATLAEAASVLKRGGVQEVWGLTLAHGH